MSRQASGWILALGKCAWLQLAMAAHAGSVTYAYDAAGRLVDGNHGSAGRISYTYDAAGNLLERRVLGSQLAFVLALAPGWNLLSLPIVPADTSLAAVLQGLPEGPAWIWDPAGGYTPTLELAPPRAFWVYLPASRLPPAGVTVLGSALPTAELSLQAGWNLVGPVAGPPYEAWAAPLISAAAGAESFRVWAMDGAAYLPAGRLQPGHGYWVFATVESRVRAGD